ncbi:MAG TPA: efflux RND transporter periplasmic adaptor subunit [Kofleriaceae bacterium]|nr:efflux RND transporter periplasmic adaptor subunit [Kofleriaceae bacterium]
MSPFAFFAPSRLILLGAALTACSRGDAAPSIPTAEVTAQKFTRRVTAEGNLKAVEATPITPPVPRGRPRPMKIAWLAPDGMPVKKGDVVLRFDPTDLERELESGESDLATARARLAREEVAATSAESGRQTTASLAVLELEKTQKFRPKDEEIFSRHQIADSKIDEVLSRAQMEHAREAQAIEKKLTRSKLGLLDVERRKAELTITQAKTALSALEVTAPHDGIFVVQRNWNGDPIREGEQVWPGQTVAELPLLDAMEAQVYVLEVDGGGLAAGIPAHVVIEARPGVDYEAKVKHVDELAQPRQQDLPVQYIALTLELAKTDAAAMKPGQRVRATLVLDKDEALVVPRQAVFDRDGKSVVYRQEKGAFVPVEVELGASTPGRVVVEKGLAAGDTIALRDPTRSDDEKKETPGGEAAAAGGSTP